MGDIGKDGATCVQNPPTPPLQKGGTGGFGVRSSKFEAQKERTPHVFTYRRVVERLVDSGVESALLDAACLMEAASGIPRWQFILDPEQSISSDRSCLLESMLFRREAREPIAYILGVKEFWSLPLTVSHDVLIPRPETETLVEAVLDKISLTCNVQRATDGNPPLTIVDLGTGSGAIALALAVEVPHALVYAIDRSPGACRIARRNIEALGLTSRIRCVQGDLLAPLRTIDGGGGCDLIVSNPPYIPSGDCGTLPPEIAAYEPLNAIDGGLDGLGYYRRIIEEAPHYLREGGWLAFEIGDGQAPVVMELVRKTEGFGPAEVRQDVAGRDRVVCAPRRGRPHG